WRNAIVVSPDAGGAKRVTALADKLGVDFALIHRKRRSRDPNAPDQMELLVGDVRGKVAILVDDMIDTGNTVMLATRSLIENGARAIYVLISHGSTFANGELSISTSATNSPENSVPSSPNLIPSRVMKSKLVILDVSNLIAESIRRTHNGESISMLFGEWAQDK
ncbi:hypothetical protein M422DRAFT_193668, partial [Sphaerobolus stellatus SS14]